MSERAVASESLAGLPRSRDDSWDLLRGIALLGVLAIHACGPYMARPLAGLLWPVWEQSGSIRLPGDLDLPWIDAIFWTCRGFAVPLFFYIAGIFAARSLAGGDRRQYAISRVRRCGGPLLVGTLLILPIMYFVWARGWVHVGSARPEHILGLRYSRSIQPHLHGFAHLWYLAYLLLFALTLAAVWPWAARLKSRPALSTVFPLGIVILGGLCVLALPSAVIQFRNAHYPIPGFFLYHALFFAWGVTASGRNFAAATPGAGRTFAVLSLAVLVGCATTLLIAPWQWLRPPQPFPRLPEAGTRLAIGITVTVLAVLMINGLVRGALIHRWSDRPVLRPIVALGRCSLWVYVVHPIAVGAAALGLYFVRLPVELKVIAAFAAGLLLPITLGPLAARTAIGRCLGAAEGSTGRPCGQAVPDVALSGEPIKRP